MALCTYARKVREVWGLSAHVEVTTVMIILRESLYCIMGISNQPYIHELRECTVFNTHWYVAVIGAVVRNHRVATAVVRVQVHATLRKMSP